MSICNDVKKVDRGIRTRHLRPPNLGDPRHIIYNTPTTLQFCELSASGAVSGQRKTQTTDLTIFHSKKIFDGK